MPHNIPPFFLFLIYSFFFLHIILQSDLHANLICISRQQIRRINRGVPGGDCGDVTGGGARPGGEVRGESPSRSSSSAKGTGSRRERRGGGWFGMREGEFEWRGGEGGVVLVGDMGRGKMDGGG